MNEEQELYHPASDFLLLVLNEEAPLSGSAHGDANLALLIKFTHDADKSNRDWAVFLLAQTAFDTPEIRAVFKHALGDADPDVRGEALVGIAKREPAFALPLVAAELGLLRSDDLAVEAASYVADPALLPALMAIRDDPDDDVSSMFLDEAIDSCTSGVQPDWRDIDD